ncbi:IucA/IucC family siderophore biosynthesis protein [Sanguibacter sp. YZGR15]|uniref:IucA/IucC family siderophore biosynthesis protein n=2 Tax=Sanguibacter suaedae TaxID=2795737 RepID=A0A934MAQ9_9MICO|nr:IucA/IucC family siderophore biosynthesis protein [Sanguibacter suaedae]
MAAAHRHLAAKALAEFTHERLLAPVPDREGDHGEDLDHDPTAPAAYRVELDGGRAVYRFRARRTALEHWVIDEPSLTREVDGRHAPLDALDLVLDLQEQLQVPADLLPVYLEEVSSTLASAAYRIHHGGPAVAELVHEDLATVERSMTEGHPGFVANNGRIGFGATEHAAYSPEAAAPVRLVWLAVRRATSHLALGAGVDEDTFYLDELGRATLDRFATTLRARGLDPADYRYLPVHPWQWEHRVAVTFAADVGRGDLVLLGEGDDEYQAQQSVRTFLNRSRPDRHYVKVALAVQNMGFLRGLSPAYMERTPAINDWVAGVVADDPTLRACGFRVLRERVAIGYTGDVYHRTEQPSAYRKMLAALWRESPETLVEPSQRLATMASLLHRDAAGDAFVTALVRESGVPAAVWVERYLDAYLRPVVHCLLVHDLAFMPHGENLILVLDRQVPVGVFMKDIGEEVAVLAARDLPEGVQRICHEVADDEKALAVLTDVFDGFFRHLAAILHVDGVLPEVEFWGLVARCIDRHRADHPGITSGVDLRAERFAHSCLNRLQLRNTLQMVDLTDQSSSLIYAGTLANPAGRGAHP